MGSSALTELILLMRNSAVQSILHVNFNSHFFLYFTYAVLLAQACARFADMSNFYCAW
jgi:hypothetical protein